MGCNDDIKIIPTTGRNNCGGRCIIQAHVKDGEILKLTTDTKEAAGSGVPLCACAKGLNYHKTFLGEDRLKYPMKRIGERGEGRFQRISWEEAVTIIAEEQHLDLVIIDDGGNIKGLDITDAVKASYRVQ